MTRPNVFPGELLLPSRQRARARDAELFDRLLRSFVPPDAFDVHAHLYPLDSVGFDFPRDALGDVDVGDVGISAYRAATASWMGDRCPRRGLFFGIPSSPRVDVAASNRHVAREVASGDGRASRGLMLIRPEDDPAAAASAMGGGSFAGFKVYHTFARGRCDTPNAELHEYLPPWAWEIAHARGAVIMLHLVRSRALADESNRAALVENLRRWPGAKLVLAHAARGFCADHTLDGIAALAGFDNVFFDTSAVCESPALLTVLQQFGPGRLMFGTDFPVSSTRGRCVSVAGEGFVWLTDQNVTWATSPYGQPTLVGIESLLALRQAARLAKLGDSQVEAIFRHNAAALLGLDRA